MPPHTVSSNESWSRRSHWPRGVWLAVALSLLVVDAGSGDLAEAASPPARAWHGFTSNGGTSPAQSRLYMFAGSGSNLQNLNDLWFYKLDSGWTRVVPPKRSKVPGRRAHVGWACGGGQCLAAGGFNLADLNETWVFNESTGAWSTINCKRGPCPGARSRAAVAYDPLRGEFVLFGGQASYAQLDDTHVFGLGRWSTRSPFSRPSARESAAATFVPAPVNRVVIFGGGYRNQAMNDMWAWSGTDWVRIEAPGGPSLMSHNMVLKTGPGQYPRLIVSGGYIDDLTPNTETWSFTFTSASSGTWAKSPLGCLNGSTPRPHSRMALDFPSGKKVFFGGEEDGPNGIVRYDDTVVCE